MFDKSNELFPVKGNYIYLAHCSISPLYSGAFGKEMKLAQEQVQSGVVALKQYENFLDDLRTAAARLLQTSPGNLAFVKNTSEGIGLIANGYPFEKGDQVISYIHEYPANHYPWKLQERRGVELVLLPNREYQDRAARGLASSWSMADLEEQVTAEPKSWQSVMCSLPVALRPTLKCSANSAKAAVSIWWWTPPRVSAAFLCTPNNTIFQLLPHPAGSGS